MRANDPGKPPVRSYRINGQRVDLVPGVGWVCGCDEFSTSTEATRECAHTVRAALMDLIEAEAFPVR
jgi:hypothetical protein